MIPDWNTKFANEKNAKRLEEGFQSIGLNVEVKMGKYGSPAFFGYMGGRNISGTNDMVGMEKIIFTIGTGNRVAVNDAVDGAALVHAWKYEYYGHTRYRIADALAFLVASDDNLGLCISRVPWKLDTVGEAQEFLAKYRFKDHFIGMSRENQLRRSPYVAVAG